MAGGSPLLTLGSDIGLEGTPRARRARLFGVCRPAAPSKEDGHGGVFRPYSYKMGRARQQLHSAIVSERRSEPQAKHHLRDVFATTFGEGRGLSASQRAEQERLHALASAAEHQGGPEPFTVRSGKTVTVSYYLHDNPKAGVVHREDGPAVIRTHPDGSRSEAWCREGDFHRLRGPARIRVRADGTIVSEEYFENNVRNRMDGPALVDISDDGTKVVEYYRMGRLHREDGPARTVANADGVCLEEDYFIRDQRHREDGPARIKTNAEGERSEEYWHDGVLDRPRRPYKGRWNKKR